MNWRNRELQVLVFIVAIFVITLLVVVVPWIVGEMAK